MKLLSFRNTLIFNYRYTYGIGLGFVDFGNAVSLQIKFKEQMCL